MKMTINEKRSLYESIMKDVAMIVKRHLNEGTEKQDYIKRGDLKTLSYYGQEIVHEAWSVATSDDEANVSIAKQVRAVNDKNLYIFVINKGERLFDRLIKKNVLTKYIREMNIQDLYLPLTKSSLKETDLFFMFNEKNNPEQTAKAIHNMMAIADGQFQDIKLDKKPYILYVTTDKSILDKEPLIRRASKVFIQK